MNKKICVTSVRSLGCTFIDWSLHFLSGQTHFYHANTDTLMPVSSNPVGMLNAHGHDKNHPNGSAQFVQQLELFDQKSQSNFYSTYPCTMDYASALDALGYTVDQLHDHNDQVIDYILNDYNKFFEICHQQNTKMIFVAADPRIVLYHQNTRSLDRKILSSETPTSQDDVAKEFQDIFYSKSIKDWQQLQLNDIWDIRERMALDIRPFHSHENRQFDFQYPHQWINCQELWTQPIKTIERIMQYAELEIDSSRLNQWQSVCNNWQQLQLGLLEFNTQQPHIVDAIVNGWDYPINLSFHQEVIIQHCLIYQHNLNLKTWQLSKFPSNTQALHRLLEPNIHPVPCIY
jgi:hypothetical protein